MYDAIQETMKAELFVIIGTSLNVYPAAGLVQYVPSGVPVYLIDPNPVASKPNVTHLQCSASEGVRNLINLNNLMN
jgi:NAD-dependent deacetylase